MSEHDGSRSTGQQAASGAALGKPDAPQLPRRFYKDVTVGEVPGSDGGAVFSVLLDGRPVKTPRKAVLAVPSQMLAEAVAEEWVMQGERIDPSRMPLTRLVNSTIDVVLANAEALRDEVVAYAMSDVLCYRAEAPTDLVLRQIETWDPILDWAARALDAHFLTTAGIVHVTQRSETRDAIEVAVGRIAGWRLGAVHLVTTLTGSAILALALEAGRLDTSSAWSAAHVDEDFQIAQWGEDWEAAERRQRRWRDMEAAGRLLTDIPVSNR